MNIDLVIQNDDALAVPSDDEFRLWASSALSQINYSQDASILIRISNEAEIQQLNRDYRQQDKPTNVLSFPADLPAELNFPDIGDIIICASIVEAEAKAQDKPLQSHWAHMSIHGILHLLGYDHMNDAEALEMEALETQIMIALGFAAPYQP